MNLIWIEKCSIHVNDRNNFIIIIGIKYNCMQQLMSQPFTKLNSMSLGTTLLQLCNMADLAKHSIVRFKEPWCTAYGSKK